MRSAADRKASFRVDRGFRCSSTAAVVVVAVVVILLWSRQRLLHRLLVLVDGSLSVKIPREIQRTAGREKREELVAAS